MSWPRLHYQNREKNNKLLSQVVIIKKNITIFVGHSLRHDTSNVSQQPILTDLICNIMGLLEELQRKLEEAARQAQQPGSGGNVNTDEIPNPWDQQPQQPQQQQAPNFPPGYQQPQQQAPNQQQYQQQYQAIMQQIQQLVGQVYQLGYQYGVQLAQSGYRSGLMDDQEQEEKKD